VLHLYQQPGKDVRILELHPRKVTLPAWRLAVPIAERDALADFRTGPPGTPPQADEDKGRIEASFTDPRLGELWMVGTDGALGPDRSAYLGLRKRPTVIYAGARGQPFEPLDPGKLSR
jgi:hypothetical protein